MSSSSSAGHSPHSSTDTSMSQSSFYESMGYPLILEHMLQYPGSYDVVEIPLRDMFCLNAASQPTTADRPRTASDRLRTVRQVRRDNAAQLTSSLMSHISALPSQPLTLPPHFIMNFLITCFPLELHLVDFSKALIGLDYLKSMEWRRRKQTAQVLSRLGITYETAYSNEDDVSRRHSGVGAWIARLEKTERSIEQFYSKIFINLRRWILIHELSIQPFNKQNCLAMLNTLFPPALLHGPNASSRRDAAQAPPRPCMTLTTEVLKKHADFYFTKIREVELNGPQCLDKLKAPDRRHPRDRTSWPTVHEELDSYLKLVFHNLSDTSQVHGLDDFDESGLSAWQSPRGGGQSGSAPEGALGESTRNQIVAANHGTSLTPPLGPGAFDHQQMPPRPATSHATNRLDLDKPMPPLPGLYKPLPPDRSLSNLEKIARELKRLKLARKNTPGPSANDPDTNRESDPDGSDGARNRNPDELRDTRINQNSSQRSSRSQSSFQPPGQGDAPQQRQHAQLLLRNTSIAASTDLADSTSGPVQPSLATSLRRSFSKSRSRSNSSIRTIAQQQQHHHHHPMPTHLSPHFTQSSFPSPVSAPPSRSHFPHASSPAASVPGSLTATPAHSRPQSPIKHSFPAPPTPKPESQNNLRKWRSFADFKKPSKDKSPSMALIQDEWKADDHFAPSPAGTPPMQASELVNSFSGGLSDREREEVFAKLATPESREMLENRYGGVACAPESHEYYYSDTRNDYDEQMIGLAQ